MNNWLAFSLSPQELQPSQPLQSDDVSSDCYGLAIDSSSGHPLSIATMRPDASSPFPVLDAFNRTHYQHQDQNMNGSSSELSMLVGSSSNMNDDEPKLEDFLGGHSFSDHDQKLTRYDNSNSYMFSNCSLQLPAAATEMVALPNGGNGGSANNNGNIGISMIKTWLRNQPAALPETNSTTEVCGANAGALMVTSSSQGLSLSMSTGSQSSSPLPLLTAGANGGGEGSLGENKNKGSGGGLDAKTGAIESVPRKSIDTFGQRTSIYRGVTRHRWTGRYEAHLWDNSCRREGQTRKGRQVYLGGYDKEDKAARSYDLAALKYWGTTTTTNFPISNYEKELEEMKHMTRQEYVASLRRKSSGFSRGASIYRGVTRHHQHGRWQARIGRVAGNKDLYLGTFSTQEEAAEAYDIAAIKFRGLNAVTNFEMSRYDVNSILESSTLPIGGAAKRLKEASEASVDGRIRTDVDDTITSQLTDGISYGTHHYHHSWPTIAFQQAQAQAQAYHYNYGQARGSWCKQEQDPAAITAAHGLQDLQQLQLTHNFFQPSGMHNLMNLDSSSMEHSTDSNSVIYNGSIAAGSTGSYNQAVMGGYEMPMGTMVVDNENMLAAATDPFTGRNVYNYQATGVVKENNGYDQNTWMVSSVPGSANNMGAPLFSVWNDA